MNNSATTSSTNPAINPSQSASVSASAGTGKTWLLVSRLVRLLLSGVSPDGILAITFTRKAAAEMQQRLSQRLLQLATAKDDELRSQLQQLEAPYDSNTCEVSRRLYEKLLHAPRNIQITTFHAFCQDILRRFPLEANVAPGFELLDQTADLQQTAWDLLFNEATNSPDSPLAADLDTLFDFCGTVNATRNALEDFLQHRSDWWALTETDGSSFDVAQQSLETFFNTDVTINAVVDFFSPQLNSDAVQFAELLFKHNTSTNNKHATCIQKALQHYQSEQLQEALELFKQAFLTKNGTLLLRKYSKTLEKSLGTVGVEQFLQLHEQIGNALLQTLDQIARTRSLQVNSAWYRVGTRLLEQFQQLKAEQRVLDFTDLEWKAYQLLNLADHAHWVQYKLDARINHLLIDEFQDTNPTQWQLIAPLLSEMANEYGGNDKSRQRSVFIVGDRKQSIYRFRRADPELFDTARSWLDRNLDAICQPLDKSWRSSPAIIDTVNKVFSHPELQKNMPGFIPHSTHHKNLWGRVEILPLADMDTDDDVPSNSSQQHGLRNPLHTPRIFEEDMRHYHEGQIIAQKIRQLLSGPECVTQDSMATAIGYNHIMILLRNRTHAHAYEQALRETGIPYAGAERGTLLGTLEIRDMLALLELLITPHNDLALAHTLRSPIFDCGNDDLIQIALQPQKNWIQRLELLSTTGCSEALRYAHQRLTHWRKLADMLPVHDLLDRIFNEGNIIERYQAAYPSHLQARVQANLTRFLELALEVNSGRYPSIGRFLLRLKTLRQLADQAPDESPANLQDAHVRILTIHASKGLEAPVIFLADSANTLRRTHSNQAVVDWPADQPRPRQLILAGKTADQDSSTQQLLTTDQLADQQEDANLLYVAITRARQYLFVSGCKPNRGDNTGWYGLIRRQLAGDDDDGQQIVALDYGVCPPRLLSNTNKVDIDIHIDPRLSSPLPLTNIHHRISPSEQAHSVHINAELDSGSSVTDVDTQLRGRLIHRLLELLSNGNNTDNTQRQVQEEFGLPDDDELLTQCTIEAERVFQHPDLRFLFDPEKFIAAYNEMPIQYRKSGHEVVGIIDRLVIHHDSISLVDYKTHTGSEQDLPQTTLDTYDSQLSLYADGVSQLWVDKPVHTMILFTHHASIKKF